MSPAESPHQYEVRWYATFWDERDQQIVHRVSLGPGKIAIPLDAMYMTVDAEVRAGSGDEAGGVCPKCGTTGCLEDKASGF